MTACLCENLGVVFAEVEGALVINHRPTQHVVRGYHAVVLFQIAAIGQQSVRVGGLRHRRDRRDVREDFFFAFVNANACSQLCHDHQLLLRIRIRTHEAIPMRLVEVVV